MSKPIISILLPFYNNAIFFEECLESIRMQSFEDFEVIMVNDGSTDESLEIAKAYSEKDNRFKLFSFDENRGIVAALNEGIEKCQGEYIARMDADDVMLENRLERQYRFALENPSIDLYGCQVELQRTDAPVTNGQKNYIGWSNSLLTDEAIKEEMFVESAIIHPTFFMKRDFMEKMGGYQDNPWAEDYDFILRAFNNGARFGKLNEKLLIKRDHPERVVRNDARCKRKAMFQAKVHYFKRSRFFDVEKEIYLIGTGQSAKLVHKALKREGILIDGVVDILPRNRTIIFLETEVIDFSEIQEKVEKSFNNIIFIISNDDFEKKSKILSWLRKNITIKKYFTQFI